MGTWLKADGVWVALRNVSGRWFSESGEKMTGVVSMRVLINDKWLPVPERLLDLASPDA